MITLRPYQLEAIQAIKDQFEKTDTQFIELPTGAGKTVTFLSYASENHERVLILVPSKELQKQVYESALLFYPKKDISRKGNGYSERMAKLHICIIHSIRGDYLKHVSDQYFDLIVIDEAHHIQANSYKRLIEEMAFAPYLLGVTATPDRADGKMIKELLSVCSYQISIEELIDQNYLCDVEGLAVRTGIDLNEIDSHNGDFSSVQLYKKLSNTTRNNLIVDTHQKEMQGRKSLIFCINVQHSQEIASLLNKSGISAKAIYGMMKEEEKQSILKGFRDGQISCLCNCQLLTEGFDEPSIDGIILARPTKSRALFMQMIGRGLRISQGKDNCKIIDIVDNHRFLSNFSHLLEEDGCSKEIEHFKGIKRLREFIEHARIESIETKIERIDFFKEKNYLDEEEMLLSQHEYLKDVVKYYGNLSIDEASFLIWITELRKKEALCQ